MRFRPNRRISLLILFVIIIAHSKLKSSDSVENLELKREGFNIGEFVFLSCVRFLQRTRLSNELETCVKERCNFVSNQLKRPDLTPIDKEALSGHINDCITLIRSQSPNQTTAYVKLRNSMLKAILFLTSASAVNLEMRSRLLANHVNLAMEHLRKTQDPGDCLEHAILICDPTESHLPSKFDSRVNFGVMCLAGAVATNRRLLLKSPENFLLFQDWFLPISANCQSQDKSFLESFNVTHSSHWPALEMDKPVIMTPKSSTNPGIKSSRFPPNVPPEIGRWEDIEKLTGDPSMWYMGVLATFLTRLQYDVWHKFVDKARSLGIPIEAKKPYSYPSLYIKDSNQTNKPASVHKFMAEVETFYLKKRIQNAQSVEGQKVILALNNSKVLSEVTTEYDQYTFLTNHTSSLKPTSSDNSSMQMNDALDDIYTINILTRSEIFIGSYSSVMGCLIYVLRMAKYPNAELTSKSIGYPCFGVPLFFRAIQDHKNRASADELLFLEGDVIRSLTVEERQEKISRVENSMAKSLAFGFHLHTKTFGSFPEFKVMRIHHE